MKKGLLEKIVEMTASADALIAESQNYDFHSDKARELRNKANEIYMEITNLQREYVRGIRR